MHTLVDKPAATVCQVLHWLRVGGAEILAARIARQLRGSFRFLFVCLDDLGVLGEELRSEGFPVFVLGRRPGVDWRCSRRLAGFMRREQVDVIHAHQYTPFFYGSVARLPFGGPPILFTEHGRWYPDFPRPKRIVANKLLLGRGDRVVGVGQSVRAALIRNEGIPAGRVQVIYNGIDLRAFAMQARERRSVRREIGLEDDDLVIFQVARFDPLKDHATAVAAFAHVVREEPRARLVLVGEGPELAGIQELVRKQGLDHAVRFLGLRTDVARLLQAADLFLLTSISEGIPLTVIEAMAAGLPVVATDVGGVAEIIHDGRTGLLAPTQDSAALARHILDLARQPHLGREMGQRGQQRAEALFSEVTMIESYRDLYGSLLAR